MKTNHSANSIGDPINRVDGVLKVTGQARYAAEHTHAMPQTPLVGFLVASTSAVGEITHLDTSKAEKAEGVQAVLTHTNAGPLKAFSQPDDEGRFTQSRAVLNDSHIRHYGMPVALVLAHTLEQARYAASLVAFNIDAQPAQLLLAPEQATEVPESLDGGFEPDVESGVAPTQSATDINVDMQYTTPSQISAAMEPHATIAHFDGDKLTVYPSVQIVASAVQALATTLEMDEDNIHVKSPFIGGGFGSKLGLHYDAILACIGARYLERPVKVALSRRHVFYNTPHRGHSFQRMQLSCNSQGYLTSIAHHSAMPKAKGYTFAEATGAGARVTYHANYINSTHRVKSADTPLIDSTRSPGDAIGSLAFESAIDELAHKANIDPLTFRLNNMPKVHPVNGSRFTSHKLESCLQRGADIFGWQQKSNAKPGKVIGHGVASAMRMNVLVQSSANVAIDENGMITVTTDMTDIGTGTYTILAQIAADAFNTSVDNVTVNLGDSQSPASCGSGGSFGAASTGSAVLKACEAVKSSLLSLLPEDYRDAQFLVTDKGLCVRQSNSEKIQETPLISLIDSTKFPISELGAVSDEDTSDDEQYSCGAHFVEVEVDTLTAEVRLKRQYGMFSAGRILNEKTAKSQIKGGMVWGAGYALTEAIHHHTDSASFVNPDFGEYHIAVNRDIAEVTVDFIDSPDFEASSVGAKGIGELGITGAGAAIANAIFDATGVRVRDFPITLDKVLEGLNKKAS